jgi:hypothetical protein
LAALKSRMAAKGAPTEAIAAAFIKSNREVIEREIDDLVYTAVMKYIGNVAAVRPGKSPSAQAELFDEYAVKQTLLYPMPDGSKIHRQVQTLTVAEAHEYVKIRAQPRAQASSQLTEFTRLLDDVEPYKVSDGSTIGECWIAYRDSGDE